MPLIRPEVTDLIWRAREVVWAGLVVALGGWLIALGGYVLIPLGAVIGGIGLVLAVTALRRMRFEQSVAAPGLVELDEAQVGYMGPEVGGYLSLNELVELRLLSLRGRRVWRLKQADGQALLIPVDAKGAERLFDAFANLPGMVVMAAADEAELVHMVATAAAHNSGPIAFRYPRGEGTGVDMPPRGIPLEIGKGRLIQQGTRVALLSFGTRLSEVQKAAEALVARGLTPTIADARFAKPLDRDLILHLARTHEALITVEEGAIGGFASHVAHLLAEEGIFDTGLKFRSMVLPDTFIDQASPEAMYRVAGMDAAQIEAKVLQTLGVAVVGKRA